MNYLIDTHILLWFQINDKKLKSSIFEILTNPENTIFVSDTSLFEIAIKTKINKLEEFEATIEDIIFVAKQDKFLFLPINHDQLMEYNNTPLFDNHKDPFDRLIITTAIKENLTLISSDEKFKLYSDIVELIEA